MVPHEASDLCHGSDGPLELLVLIRRCVLGSRTYFGSSPSGNTPIKRTCPGRRAPGETAPSIEARFTSGPWIGWMLVSSTAAARTTARPTCSAAFRPMIGFRAMAKSMTATSIHWTAEGINLHALARST